MPLLMRGPGIRAGVEVRDLVANVDLAPTILDASGAKPRLREDGRSLLPITRRPGDWSGRSLAIEGNRYRGVRTARYIYVHWIRGPDHGATELYDLERDPYELRNLHGVRSARGVERALAKRLRGVERCAGKECLAEPGLRLRAAAEGGDRPRRVPAGSLSAWPAGTPISASTLRSRPAALTSASIAPSRFAAFIRSASSRRGRASAYSRSSATVAG